MTNEQPSDDLSSPTIYKFAYYYTTGDGSNDSEPYTNKEEAEKEFRLMVKDEITDEWTAEDEVMDYAKLWSCKEDEDEEETDEENILFWSFEWGFTKCDQPTTSPKDFLLEEARYEDLEGEVMKEGYTYEEYETYLNGLTLEQLREEFIGQKMADTIEEAIANQLGELPDED